MREEEERGRERGTEGGREREKEREWGKERTSKRDLTRFKLVVFFPDAFQLQCETKPGVGR